MSWEDAIKEVIIKLPAFAALIWMVTLVFRKDTEASVRQQENDQRTAERTAAAFAAEAENRKTERELWANLLQQMIQEKDERYEQLTLKLNGSLQEAAKSIGEVKAFMGESGIVERRRK